MGLTTRRLISAVLAPWCLIAACGSPETYSRGGTGGRPGDGTGGEPSDADVGTGGQGSGGGGGTPPVGTGGEGSGGSGTGGSGTGGSGTGGSGIGGGAPGGTGSGGRSMGGSGGGGISGGNGSGGIGTGGMGTGGVGQGTGGQGTGGQATGGQGTGGQATGGQGTGGASGQQIISIDFVGGRTTAGIAMGATETAGAKPASHWNSATGATGSLAALALSDGTTTTASVSWNAPGPAPGTWSVNYTDAPGDVRMMNGYLDPAWTSTPASAATLATVSSLPTAIAAGQYDVYVYVLGTVTSDMRSYQYGIGAATFTVVQNAAPTIPPATPYPYAVAPDMGVGTHVIFRGVTGASFALTAKGISTIDNRFRAPVNGIQIVFPTGS